MVRRDSCTHARARAHTHTQAYSQAGRQAERGKERGGGGFLLKKHASARTHNCADVNRRGRRRSGEDTLGKMDGPILRAGDAEILSGLERGMICRQLMPCLIISLLEIPLDPSPSLA